MSHDFHKPEFPLPDHVLRRIAEREKEIASRPPFWLCDVHGDYASSDDECPACRADAKRAVAQWRAAWATRSRWVASGVPRRFRSATFANFQRRSPALGRIADAVQALATSDDEGVGMVLSGGVGCGKTHLACAAIAEAVSHGQSARYVVVPELLSAIRAGFRNRDLPDEAELLAPLADVELLLLDEAGLGSGSEWEAATIARLIDARYSEAAGRTVVVTNASASDLDAAIGERAADRLREMGPVLVVPGKSYREQARTAARDQVDAIPEPELELSVRMFHRGQKTSALFARTGERIA